MKAGKRKQALGILQEGLALNQKASFWHQSLPKIDLRRKPFFSLLHRDNILNKILGKLTYQFRRKDRPRQLKK